MIMTNTTTTTKAVKITKRDNFNALLTYIPEDRQDLRDFIAHELELLDKKNKANAGKLTKAQREGVEFDEKVLASLTFEPVRPGELAKLDMFGDASVQKVSASLRRLTDSGRAVAETVGKVTFYHLAGEPVTLTTGEVEDEIFAVEE